MRITFRVGQRKRANGVEEDVDFVDIHTGRDGKDVVSHPVTDVDRALWPAEYAAYKGVQETAPVAVEAPPEPSPSAAKSTKKRKE